MEDKRGEEQVQVVGYWVSLFVHRVRWALRLKGIPYEYIEEDIYNKGPLLLSLNPVYGKVPVLVHQGKPLPESLCILEYIDETWTHGPALLPQDPYEKSQARFWARFSDEKILEASWHLMFMKGKNQEKALKTAVEVLEKVEEKLVQEGKSFFGGDTIGYLDFVMGYISYILPVWEKVAGVQVLEPVRFPAIASWMNNFLNHPIVKDEYMPSMEEMVPFYQKRVEILLPKYVSRYGE